jgi:hypothetical protein
VDLTGAWILHRVATILARLVVVLLLVVPMPVLNDLGRPAFLGYYAGVIVTWFAFSFALHATLTERTTTPDIPRAYNDRLLPSS